MFAEDEARLLLDDAGDDPALLEVLVRRRVGGEPLEQVLGWAEVAGVRVRLRPGVFVPRRRSALLVAEGASAVAALPAPRVVVDVCCGTGALGLAVARRSEHVELHAADIDPVACACAEENLRDDGTVHRGDLLDALPRELQGRVALLLVNAPYVPSDAVATLPREARDHEPTWTLDGGPDGVALHRRLAAEAHTWVRRGGTVLVETSTHQADLTAGAFDPTSWTVAVVVDAELGATAVRATRR